MASNNSKPGMMIYFDYWYAPLRILSGDEVKELLTDMIALSKDGQYPENFSCENVKVFFNQMEAVILRDDEQYTQKIEQRRRAGKASHESRQRMSADANECQRPLTDADECQRLSTNSIQLNSAQFNSIQSNSAQHISTQTNNKYWGDNAAWERRCTALGVDPYVIDQVSQTVLYADHSYCNLPLSEENFESTEWMLEDWHLLWQNP